MTRDAITEAAARGVTVYAPVSVSKGARDPHTPRPDDSAAVVAWRDRMATPEAQTVYRERAATAECVNALWKAHWGLHRLRGRGLAKALCMAPWPAVTHNLLRCFTSSESTTSTKMRDQGPRHCIGRGQQGPHGPSMHAHNAGLFADQGSAETRRVGLPVAMGLPWLRESAVQASLVALEA